jgi:hypothetical protein
LQGKSGSKALKLAQKKEQQICSVALLIADSLYFQTDSSPQNITNFYSYVFRVCPVC